MTAAGNTSTSHERWTMKTGLKTHYRLDRKSVMSVGWFSLLLSCPNWKLLFKLDQKNTTASPTSGEVHCLHNEIQVQQHTHMKILQPVDPSRAPSPLTDAEMLKSKIEQILQVARQSWHHVAFPSWHLTQNMQLSKLCTNKETDQKRGVKEWKD